MTTQDIEFKTIYDKYGTLLLDRSQLAIELNLSKSSIDKIFHTRRLELLPPYVRIGKKYLFSIKAILQYIHDDVEYLG